MANKYKTLEEFDDKKIQLMTITHDKYWEVRLLCKQKDKWDKWNELVMVRFLPDKQGGYGCVTRVNYLEPGTCKEIQPATGFICRTEAEMIEKIPHIKQEHLDKAYGQITNLKLTMS